MFEEANIKPVEHVEKPKKPRKPRKKMTEEQKQVLRERLAKAREAKKLKKEGKVVAPKAPKKEKVEIKVEDKVEEIKTFKAPMVKPVPVKDELAEMRAELKRMKTRNLQQEKELTKASLEKEKLKKQGLDYIKKYTTVKETEKLEPIKEDKIDETKVTPTAPIIKPKKAPRYSTYKKSIWAQFE